MSMYNFFKSCLKTAEETYSTLLYTPRARAAHLQKEICEILKQIDTSLKFDELTPAEANELKSAFIKLDFSNISTAQAAMIKSEKMKQK